MIVWVENWIDQPLLLAIHAREIAARGGSARVGDNVLLAAVLARPQQLYAEADPAPDVADLAASLACGIARNQPFVDGNLRTALVAYRTFLALNGLEFRASAGDKYVSIAALAEGRLSIEEFADWLRRHIVLTAEQPARAHVQAEHPSEQH